MTGYGSAKKEDKKRLVQIYLRSYNSKYLTVEIQLPREYNYIENLFLSEIKKFVHRGRIVCSVTIDEKLSDNEIFVDWNLLHKKVEAIKDILDKYDIKSAITITDLTLTEPQIIFKARTIKDDKELISLIKNALNDALKQLVQSRKAEGGKIYQALQSHLKIIEQQFDFIKKNKDRAIHNTSNRLKNKLEEFHIDEIDEARLMKELIIFIDKLDITEEINRFSGFLSNFKEIMNSNNTLIGRHLDFIIQEMIREINTIGSKTNDLEISRSVINIKSEIEKIREQIQNVE